MSDADNVDTAANYIVNSTILPNLEPAKKALVQLCGAIEFIDGSEMKKALVNTYNIFGVQIIGGKLPDDNFYYEK